MLKDIIYKDIKTLNEYKEYKIIIKNSKEIIYKDNVKAFLLDFINDKLNFLNNNKNWYSLDHLRKLFYIIIED